tara:strand:- start:3024 stop:5204 length:2181 start_codon:yes stop_codon:yes gene_type:complete
MADINRTIEIAYRAEVTNLIKGLEKVGQVSEKEAKEIVDNLDKAYEKAAKEAKKSAKKQKDALEDVAKKSEGVGKNIKESFSKVAIGAAAAGAAIFMFGQKMADMSNQLVDASAKTGVGVETLNGLRLAAEGSGLAFEELEGGLIALPQLMVMAAEGSKGAQEAFESLGVEITKTVDGFDTLKSADEVLKDIFESLKKVESAEQKAALAARIFGADAGPKFIQTGAIDNLEAFVSLAEDFGVSTGPNMTIQMANFQRVSATASNVVMGEMMRLVDVLMGGSGSGGKGLTNAILGATEAIIFLGSIAGDVFGTVISAGNLQLATMDFLIQKIVGTSEDAERAFIVMNDEFENFGKSGGAIANSLDTAQAKLEDFRKKMAATMSSSSSNGAPSPTNQTQQNLLPNIPKVTKEVNKLAKAEKILANVLKDINNSIEKQIDRRIDSLPTEEQILANRDREIDNLKEQQKILNDTLGTEIERLFIKERTAEEDEKLLELEEAFAKRSEQITTEIKDAKIDAENELFDLQMENMDKVGSKMGEVLGQHLEGIELRKQAEAQAALFMVDQLGMGFEAAAQLVETFGNQTKETEKIAFGIRKAASMADVVIETAKNVVAVAPLGPFAMGAMGAIGAAQLAVISAQQPKFHMGGMIGDASPLAPDETMVRAKRGEAILSTSAVSKIGAEGVRAIEKGQGLEPTVIVMNPFKHYDRFIKGRTAMGMGGSSTGRKGY